jgi:hypothetical protein
MISFTSEQNYYIYPEPVDMRKDINGLSGFVNEEMKMDPRTMNNVYIFLSRKLTMMKILYRGLGRFELLKIRLDAGNSFCLYSRKRSPVIKFAGAISFASQRAFHILK